MNNPKFEIFKDKTGSFRFRLNAKNGQVILASQAYSSRSVCLNGVRSVQKNATEGSHFEKLKAKNGQHYFNLKAGNGEVIGTSEMYNSSQSRDNGISSVMSNAPIAGTEEEE